MNQLLNQFPQDNPWVFAIIVAILVIWTVSWKGVALWKAAKNNSLKWFIVMLVFNTFAILEIIYIFGVAKRQEKKSEISQI